jgi:nucleoside-diphosphate-sugar epimerase
MQVLIIGGTSFIGPGVVRLLVERGHSVTVFHRGQTEADLPSGVNHISGDRRDLATFRDEFKRLAPEVVLDMICFTEPEALAAVQTFTHIASRMVTLSSMDVYEAYGRFLGIEPGAPSPAAPSTSAPSSPGLAEDARLSEDSPLRQAMYPHRAIAGAPEDFAHSYEKILVERAVMNNPELPCTVLRLPAVYGPRDPYHRTFDYLKRMRDGRRTILIEEKQSRWRWTRGYVGNVAAAVALAATDERAAGRIYNVGEQDALSESEWIRSIAAAAGWEGEIIRAPKESMPNHLVAPYDWDHHIVGDTSRIRRELGYGEVISRKEAMKRTLEWESANPPQQIDQARFDYAAEDAALEKIRP